MIVPILLYGCEICGYENTDIIENIHINFMRRILPEKMSTPTFMLYGELGRMPLKLIINQRIISFWDRIITGKQTKVSALLHELMLWDSTVKGLSYKWTRNIENIFNNLGMS